MRLDKQAQPVGDLGVITRLLKRDELGGKRGAVQPTGLVQADDGGAPDFFENVFSSYEEAVANSNVAWLKGYGLTPPMSVVFGGPDLTDFVFGFDVDSRILQMGLSGDPAVTLNFVDAAIKRHDANALTLLAGDALIIPGGAGDFATPVNGMLWYDSTANKLRGYEGAAWGDLIGGAGGGSMSSFDIVGNQVGNDITVTDGARIIFQGLFGIDTNTQIVGPDHVVDFRLDINSLVDKTTGVDFDADFVAIYDGASGFIRKMNFEDFCFWKRVGTELSPLFTNDNVNIESNAVDYVLRLRATDSGASALVIENSTAGDGIGAQIVCEDGQAIIATSVNNDAIVGITDHIDHYGVAAFGALDGAALLSSGAMDFAELAADPDPPPPNHWRYYTKSTGLYQMDDLGAILGPFNDGTVSGVGTNDHLMKWIGTTDAQDTGWLCAATTDELSKDTGTNSVSLNPATGRLILKPASGGTAFESGVYGAASNFVISAAGEITFGTSSDLRLSRKAAGTLGIRGGATGQGVLRLYEGENNGNHFWEILPVSSITADTTLFLPNDTPAVNDVITWQTSGLSTWEPRITYAIPFQIPAWNPTDAQTVYFGGITRAPSTVANTDKIFFRQAGVIKIVNLYTFAAVAGSNQAWSLYVRLNDTTDTLVATVSAATQERIFNNSGLAIAVAAGDYIQLKMVNPTWTTDPTGVLGSGYLYVG